MEASEPEDKSVTVVKVCETMVPETYKDKSCLNQNLQEGSKKRSILVGIMYAEWVIMAFLIGLIFIRLVYSTDRNWVYSVILTLILIFLLTPIFITVSLITRFETENCTIQIAKKKKEGKKVSAPVLNPVIEETPEVLAPEPGLCETPAISESSSESVDKVICKEKPRKKRRAKKKARRSRKQVSSSSSSSESSSSSSESSSESESSSDEIVTRRKPRKVKSKPKKKKRTVSKKKKPRKIKSNQVPANKKNSSSSSSESESESSSSDEVKKRRKPRKARKVKKEKITPVSEEPMVLEVAKPVVQTDAPNFPEEKKVQVEVKVETNDENTDGGGSIEIHTHVGEDELDVDTKVDYLVITFIINLLNCINYLV